MGLNAYFAYQVVGPRGTGSVSYGLALTAVFVEGFIFLFLALTGMRHWLVKIIPATIKTASGVGIGMFLTLVGMSYTEGIGIITGNVTTPLAIAGCDPYYLDPDTGACTSHLMQNPKVRGRLRSVVFVPNADCVTDVAWHHLRWNLDDVSHGIPSQGGYSNWCLVDFDLVMAVSS